MSSLRSNLFVLLIAGVLEFASAAPQASVWRVMETNLALDPLSPILFIDDQVGWVVIRGQISKTTDGGANWITLNTNLPEQDAEIVRLSFADRLHGWGAGRLNHQATIWETSDGGTSWKVQYSVPLDSPDTMTPGPMRDIQFADRLRGWAVGGNQGNAIIVATQDGGQHWKTQYSGSEITEQFNRVRVWDSMNAWVMGAESVLRTENGGESWQLQYFGGGGLILNDIDVAGRSDVWITGPSGLLLHTSDGLNWSKVKRANLGSDAFLSFVKFVSKDVGWVVGPNDTIVMTQDGGKTWKRDAGHCHANLTRGLARSDVFDSLTSFRHRRRRAIVGALTQVVHEP